MVRRASLLLGVAWTLFCVGCGQATEGRVANRSAACLALVPPDPFPPGFAFLIPEVAGDPLEALVTTFARSTVVPLAIETTPFGVAPGKRALELPADVDGDGADDFAAIDDIAVAGPDLAFVTTSGSERVLFLDPRLPALRTAQLSLPESLDPANTPVPSGPEARTGIRSDFCIFPRPGALDSRGRSHADPLAIPPPLVCNAAALAPNFRASFTSGVQRMGDRLFVAMSNLGQGQGRADTQYLAPAVLVFRIEDVGGVLHVEPATDTPDGSPVILLGEGHFNATHLTPHRNAAGREFLLVTLTGAVGIRPDDLNTSEIESGTLPLSDGAVDVIDVESARLVASFPLASGTPGGRGPAIDPTGRVAVFGDSASRELLAIDLSVLDSLPAADQIPFDEPIVFGENGAPFGVIFDGVAPFPLPHSADGPAPDTCPGHIDSVAFSADGRSFFAADTCDGTLFTVALDVSAAPTTQELRARFQLEDVLALTAPIVADTFGLPRQPTALAVRPGAPGLDYAGPELFFLVAEEAAFCGIRP